MNKRINIIGSEISVTNMESLLTSIKCKIDSGETDYICVSNVHTVITAKEDEYYKTIINYSFMSVPDGMPLVWVGRKRGYKDIGRTAGPDIMENTFKSISYKKYKHYFYGSTRDTLDLMKDNLMKEYPYLNIVGMKESYFRPLTEEEDKEIVDEINSLKPDLIWVGLGAPRQEKWMYEHREKIKSSLMIGVGGAFAIYADLVDRAPLWMQKHGLEWLYRLIKEPGRLWKRYLVTNFKFIFYLICDRLKIDKPQL